MKMNEMLLKSLPFANYVQALEIKMTKNNKGRGLFTTRFVKKGELLIAEKPIAFAKVNDKLPAALSTDWTYTSYSK